MSLTATSTCLLNTFRDFDLSTSLGSSMLDLTQEKRISQCSIYNQNIRSGIYPLELINMGLEGTLFKLPVIGAHCHEVAWWEGGISAARISDLIQARTKVKKETSTPISQHNKLMSHWLV